MQIHGKYWDKWTKTISLDIFPDCGVNILGAGADDILQAFVDTYCGVEPGGYVAYINPKVINIYRKQGAKYPDGQTAVLLFEKIGIIFTINHIGGQPIYNVFSIKDGKSIASKKAGYPMNPETCVTCHAGFNEICKKLGYVCGNRELP